MKSKKVNSIDFDLVTIINTIKSNWKINKNLSPRNINNGYCMDFAEEVISKINTNTNINIEKIYSEFLYDYEDLGFYYKEQQFNEIELCRWNKMSVEQYGGLPEIINIGEYEPDTHVWIYFNGKHYDAENDKGVNNWYELNFFKRDIKRFVSFTCI